MKILKVITCFFLLPIMSCAQAITFTKYIDFGVDNSFNILELSDGYLTITSAGHPIIPRPIYIIKTDFYGDTLWVKEYGKSYQYFGIYSLSSTYDSNFVSGGYEYDDSLVVSKFFLMKFNINGDTLWTKEYNAPVTHHYNGACVMETADNGFLITGQRGDSAFTDGDVTILKTDSVGNFQWVKNFGGNKYESGWSSVELPDKGFLTLGWSRSFSFGDRDLYLIKTDSLGNLIWQKHYGTTFLDGGRGITKTADGNYLLAGYKGLPSMQSVNAWLLKVDTSGAILWQQTLTNSVEAELWWARELTDGNIIGAGAKTNINNTLDSAWIVKTDASGNKLWERGFVSYNNHSCFRDVQPTTDNGFICAGWVYDGPNGTQDAWLIKLDSMGCDSTGCAQYTGVGIENIDNETEFSLYPNPVQDVLNIRFKFSLYGLCDVKVYNMLGEQVYSTRSFIQKQTTIPTAALPPGMYFVSLKYEGQTVTRKFVKAP